MAKSLRDRQKNKPNSFSEYIISKLQHSSERMPIDLYGTVLLRTLHWLNEDHELEEFVAGIPGLYWSDALTTRNEVGAQRDISKILSTLPGPTSFHASLSWSIIHLAQRAVASSSSNTQQQRTQTCIRALYCIPGAIRDVLAPYAVGKHNCLEILPLLNSSESLEIIDELWDTPNHEIAISVRCAAAVIAAFMITPPRVLDSFVTPNVGFIGDDIKGTEFLAKRLRIGLEPPIYDRDNDSARLGNLVRFLRDTEDTLRDITRSSVYNDAPSIRQERRALFEMRHTQGFRNGRDMFDPQGDRGSSAFVPAAQQDLITLTLEILARDSIVNAAPPLRAAFRDVWLDVERMADPPPWWARGMDDPHAYQPVRLRDTDGFQIVTRPLEPVLRSLRLEARVPLH